MCEKNMDGKIYVFANSISKHLNVIINHFATFFFIQLLSFMIIGVEMFQFVVQKRCF